MRDKGVIYVQVSHSAAAALCRDYGLPENDIPKCVLRVKHLLCPAFFIVVMFFDRSTRYLRDTPSNVAAPAMPTGVRFVA